LAQEQEKLKQKQREEYLQQRAVFKQEEMEEKRQHEQKFKVQLKTVKSKISLEHIPFKKGPSTTISSKSEGVIENSNLFTIRVEAASGAPAAAVSLGSSNDGSTQKPTLKDVIREMRKKRSSSDLSKDIMVEVLSPEQVPEKSQTPQTDNLSIIIEELRQYPFQWHVCIISSSLTSSRSCESQLGEEKFLELYTALKSHTTHPIILSTSSEWIRCIEKLIACEKEFYG
jgi:hypothetical protein